MNSLRTIKDAIQFIRASLQEIYPPNEIQSFIWILAEYLWKLKKIDLHLAQDTNLSEKDAAILMDIASRLKNQEPIQYILQESYFYELKLTINSSVLIPRQETEELVQWIIEDSQQKEELCILDIGTGSGCIPIALAKNLKHAKISALDISVNALNVAKENAKTHGVEINFFQHDILNKQSPEFDCEFDLIVSNPPYIKESEKAVMQNNVLKFEPRTALFVPDNAPLLFYDAIANLALSRLKTYGMLYLEINENLAHETASLLEYRNFIRVEIRKDIHGKNRMIRAQKDALW